MPLKYVPPDEMMCDYCGARSGVPKGLSPPETRCRLEAIGWTNSDFVVLCPRCQRMKENAKGRGKSSRLGSVPIIGRLFR